MVDKRDRTADLLNAMGLPDAIHYLQIRIDCLYPISITYAIMTISQIKIIIILIPFPAGGFKMNTFCLVKPIKKFRPLPQAVCACAVSMKPVR